MHAKITLTTLLLLPAATMLGAEPLSKEDRITEALLAAPEGRRDGAAVIGWNDDGSTSTLREGTNDLVCLGPAPEASNYSVACYHKDLEPYMARGRELLAEGVTGAERVAEREAEVEEGKIDLPREARTLYVLHGKGFDAAAGEITEPYLRYVIYTPYATPESTGLTTESVEGAPWLMAPGTAGAHIMINPPRD